MLTHHDDQNKKSRWFNGRTTSLISFTKKELRKREGSLQDTITQNEALSA